MSGKGLGGRPPKPRASNVAAPSELAELRRVGFGLRAEIARLEVFEAASRADAPQTLTETTRANVLSFLSRYNQELTLCRYISLHRRMRKYPRARCPAPRNGRPSAILRASSGRHPSSSPRPYQEIWVDGERAVVYRREKQRYARSAPEDPSPASPATPSSPPSSVNKADLSPDKRELLRDLRLWNFQMESCLTTQTILNNRYFLLSVIGKGGFSEVWLAMDMTTLREVACKIHQLNISAPFPAPAPHSSALTGAHPSWSAEKKASYARHVTREYAINKFLKHKNIVSLYDVFEIDSNTIATVLEFCSGMDLEQLLLRHKALPEEVAKAIIGQVVEALYYMNTQVPPSFGNGEKVKIIHYDLKPGNILLGEDGTVKVTDFGLSKIFNFEGLNERTSMELTSVGAGTYWYLPPECFNFSQAPARISSKVDVWSVGVIYYQMIFGKKPFGDGMSQEQVLERGIMKNATTVVFPESPSLDAEGRDFVLQCLTHSQAERPDVVQIYRHAYLRDVVPPVPEPIS